MSIRYFSEFIKTKFSFVYLFLCTINAVIMTFSVYPFIGFADGFMRWRMANQLIEQGYIEDSFLSPVIPLISAMSYKITNSYGLFTFGQTLCFYIAVGLLCRWLIGKNMIPKINVPLWIIISCILVFFIPTIRIFPLLLTDSALLFVFLVLLCILIDIEKLSKISFVIRFILLAICTIFIVALRLNAATAIIGLIIALLFIKQKITYKTICITVMIISLVIGAIFPKMMIKKTYHAETLGMIWELTRIAKDTGNEELIVKMSEFGDVTSAIERYSDEYLNSIVWDNDPPFPANVISTADNASKVRSIYIGFAMEHPIIFFENKFHFIANTMGINMPLISSIRGMHYVDGITMSFGAIETHLNTKIRNEFVEFTDHWKVFTLHPWVLILVNFLLFFINYKRNVPHLKRRMIAFVSAVSYYISFCMNTQALEFRYFAPSLFILIILLISNIINFSQIMLAESSK